MGLISLPYSLTAHSTAKASEVMADFNAILAAINGGIDDENLKSPTAGVRRELLTGSAVVLTGDKPILEVFMVDGSWLSTGIALTSERYAPKAYYFKAADHTVANKTTKLVLRGTVVAEHSTPLHTFKLYPVSSVISSEFGGKATWGLNLGAAVMEKAVAAAAAGTFTGEVEASVPADGLYVLGFKAASEEAHAVVLNATLFAKNV